MKFTFDSQESFAWVGEGWTAVKVWLLELEQSLKVLDSQESRDTQLVILGALWCFCVAVVIYNARKKRKAKLDAKVTLTQDPMDERQATARRA